MKRLFLGLELNEESRAATASVQDRLRAVATRQGVRFVRPEKIHLTLVFLGPQPDEALARISETCENVGQGHERLELSAREIGGFPNLFRPKILWAGVDGDLERLRMLQVDLAQNLRDFADPDEKNYSPHITLARISPGSKEVGRLATSVAAEVGTEEFARWTSTEFVLFESTPDGRYEALGRIPLL